MVMGENIRRWSIDVIEIEMATTATSDGDMTDVSTNVTLVTGTHARLPPYPEWLVILLWLLTTIFSIETILGNLLVLLAYKLERSIRRQLSNKFIVSLALTDLIIGMEGFPLLTVYVVGRERWPLGQTLCQIWLCLDYTLCLVSILTVLLITVDRYGSVCYPAKYRTWQTNTRVRVFIVFSWIVPSLFFGVMIFAWDALTGNRMDESGKCYAPFLNDPYVNMAMYIVYYWTTLVAVSVLYRGIHTAAKTLEDKSKARERQTIALLLGQRCMAQVGVGMLLHSHAEEMPAHENTYFQRAPNGEQDKDMMEMAHDSGYMTTSATGTTHTNFSGGSAFVHGHDQRSSLTGTVQENLTVNVPIIITQSPPSSVSLSSNKVSPAVAPPPLAATSANGRRPENAPMQIRRLSEDEFQLEAESTPLVPFAESAQLSMPRTAIKSIVDPAGFEMVNGNGEKINFDNNSRRKRSSLPMTVIHRRLTPIHSLDSSPRKETKIDASVDEDYSENDGFQSQKRGRSIIHRRQLSNRYRQPKKRTVLHQDSGNSLEFYAGSNYTSTSSIYGDASLNSVLEFDDLLCGLDSLESTETSTSASVMLDKRRSSSLRCYGRNWKTNLADIFKNRTQSQKVHSHENGDLMRTSSLTSSSTWTRSASTSIRSQYSMPVEENQGAASCSSSPFKSPFRQNSVKVRKVGIVKLEETPTRLEQELEAKISYPLTATPQPTPIQAPVPPSDSFLPPIIEEEKSTTTKTEADLISRRGSTDPTMTSPPLAKKNEKIGKRPSDKIVHLTVPGQPAPGLGNVAPAGRKSSSSSTGRRRGTDYEWQRASWQSTASSIFRVTRRKTRRGTRALDDDDDSDGRDPGSSAEDSTSDRKRSTSWLHTLFNNPVSILHRKRKVTKAEKRARKAFRTITVIVGTFALFWSPYYIVATIYGFCQDCVPAPLFLTSYYLCYLNSSVNPFAYAFANRLFRKTFLRILRGDLRRT